MSTSRTYKRQIPLALTFIVGMIVTFDWFISWDPLQSLTTTLMNYQIVMVAFMMGFAGVNLVYLHSRRIQRSMSENKLYDALLSAVLLACLFIWIIVGVGLGMGSDQYTWLFNTFNQSLSATAYAATLFYLASATYRVLRIRSAETGILLLVGFITICANIPLFKAYFPFLGTIIVWISDGLVKYSYRAITIGVGLGGILMGVRTLLAMETGYLGATEE
jgi:small-conductance mechanosensitive channel